VPRVRHHTDDAGLKGIRKAWAILPARGIVGAESGVHVEVEPFRSARPGLGGPRAELGCFAEGAFVEFDAPAEMIPTRLGPRNTAMIPTPVDQPFLLLGRTARFVKVRRHWWELWRTKAR
jgi:hypothetical protein